jgi:hypothetical protein
VLRSKTIGTTWMPARSHRHYRRERRGDQPRGQARRGRSQRGQCSRWLRGRARAGPPSRRGRTRRARWDSDPRVSSRACAEGWYVGSLRLRGARSGGTTRATVTAMVAVRARPGKEQVGERDAGNQQNRVEEDGRRPRSSRVLGGLRPRPSPAGRPAALRRGRARRRGGSRRAS